VSLTENEVQLVSSTIARLTSLGSKERMKELTIVVSLIAVHDYKVSSLDKLIILSPPDAPAPPLYPVQNQEASDDD
jgi:hypothetical protein